jgi:hypothetical protein
VRDELDTTRNPLCASAAAPLWPVAQRHSRYLRDLLAVRPEIAAWLNEHAALPLTARQMSDFLATAAPSNEET